MAQIAIIERKCDGCGACAGVCPFAAIEMRAGHPDIGAACRVCGMCVKACPRGAIVRLEAKAKGVDKSKWRGTLVFVELAGGAIHPVSLELIGKARSLAAPVTAVMLGEGLNEHAEELRHYGADYIYVYDSPELGFFRAEAFADCLTDAISAARPASVLVGATALGRSLAPRAATRLRTGLTADCTRLEMRESGDLVQIRPAFGGNIMAQIITPNTRPQFATVRYKVMEAPARSSEASGEIIYRRVPQIASRVRLLAKSPLPKAANISEADVLVVGGRGLRREADLGMIRKLAELLGGEWATSRPLAEKGWSTNLRQIGLSGRTVRPKLIITFGVSGAIQFASCMNQSEHIIAVNSDPEAPIFKTAHVAIVGDLYDILPRLIDDIKRGKRA